MSVKGRSPELRGIKPLIELSYIAAPRSFVGWHGKSLKLTKSRKFFITLVALLFICHYHCSMWQKFNFVKKKIKTKTCKNLPKQCTVIPFTNKHWVSLYNVLEMIRSYPTRGWKQYLTHSPASGYVSLRSFVHSWQLSQIWKQRSHLYCTYSKMTTVTDAVCGRWAKFNKSFYLLQSIYDSYTIITQYIKQQVSIWIRFYTKQDVLL